MPPSFTDRSVLLTGGGSGIGRATARRFAELGAQVRIGDVDDDGMAETASMNAGISAVHCNVADEASVAAFVDGAVADHGDLDIVVNLAGVLTFENSHQVALADWQRVIDINLTGTFLVCRAALAHLVDPQRGRTGGVIVNTASTAAHIGQAWSAAYCASKGAVLALSRALAVEYAGRGIRVNSISPGAIETPIMAAFAFPEGVDQSLLTRTMPLDAAGSPDEVAAAITYLASDEARYVKGADLRIDGATTA
jgi:meso-butanediol dehydrogenase/(S,S)-butanediol dehydrogenase/diacetyl reductase